MKIKYKRIKEGDENKAVVFELLKNNGYSTYKLRKEKILGEAIIQKIRQDDSIEWETLDKICGLAQCSLDDIVEYIVISGLENFTVGDLRNKIVSPEEAEEIEEKKREKGGD